MRSVFLALLIFAAPALAYAENALKTVTGPGIDLKLKDHAFSGMIRDHLVFGVFDVDTHQSEVWVRLDEKRVSHGSYSLVDGQISGGFEGLPANKVTLLNVDPIRHEIIYRVGTEKVTLSIHSPHFVGDRFDDPDYACRLRGKDLKFHVQGNICYNCSSAIGMLLLSAWIVLP